MRTHGAKSRTADLFAAVPAAAPAAIAAPAATLESVAAPPASAARPLRRQLWYAVVFPELTAPDTLLTLQRLCVHAQGFTSFVSIEPPNALLLEIRGSVKLFGSLQKLHADIDACWRRLGLSARSATTPSTLAALWLARAGRTVHYEGAGQPGGRPTGWSHVGESIVRSTDCLYRLG